MLDEKLIPPHEEELKSNDVVKFFDNVYDENGVHLVQAPKRAYIKKLMETLYNDAKRNQIKLEDGTSAPIVVKRKYEGRASFCYFNTHELSQDEALKAFADIFGITYINKKPETKQKGELIAQEALFFLDDIKLPPHLKKLTGKEKSAQVILLFQQLYNDPIKNICTLEDGTQIPIIIQKTGENNKLSYCLNSKLHRKEVFRAFAKETDCIYLEYKEEDTIPENKHPRELTARQCAKLFHKVGFLSQDENKQEGKERILQWFHHIYSKPELNNIKLPDGREINLLVRRLSGSQRCLCLNTEDTYVKPFVLKRFRDITESEFCFENLDLSKDDKPKLNKLLYNLAKISDNDFSSQQFYQKYSQRAFEELKLKTHHLTVTDYLIEKAKDAKRG
ncbi:MAG: hypothetical protein IKW58_03805 [Alphaproteobacteria bacterium]|nr:hypothetical protein [Alphaproteobacteria bacterium]